MPLPKLYGLIVSLTISICIVGNNGQPNYLSFVDPNIVLKDNFEGWGTSLAWWADMVGGMDEKIASHVVDALFSPSKLNLNIARYVIGGTTPNNYTCGEYRDGAATESFKDGFDSPYNWDRDLRQREILQLAKAAGANLFEAFSNTPPQWMTISGCSKGNGRTPPLFSNFNVANSPHFADYATEVIKYFYETLNITFATYSPFNEPYGLHGIGGWVGPTQSQEGCNMGRPTMVTVIKDVHEAITAKNLSFVKIAVSDETQINTQIQSYEHFLEAGVSELFQQINVHGYWDDTEVNRRDLLSSRCEKRGHTLWMDEMGWGGTPIDDMDQGINIATRIIKDFRTMIPSAWVYWQAVEDIGQWGLLEVPYHNTTLDDIRYNSGYYALEQFSQHIRKGYKLIYVSDPNTIAALNENMDKLVLVILNAESTNITKALDLNLFDSAGQVKLFRTSASEQHVDLPPPSVTTENQIELNCPPQSISTLEISNITLSRENPTNEIKNGNFESVIETESGNIMPTAWSLVHGESNEVDGATAQNSWRGNFSGVLQLGPLRSSTLLQNITLNAQPGFTELLECNCYLSVWCSSTQSGTTLGVLLNGTEITTQIQGNGVFNSYALTFPARTNDTFQVYFSNSGATLVGTAKIDNVKLLAKCG